MSGPAGGRGDSVRTGAGVPRPEARYGLQTRPENQPGYTSPPAPRDSGQHNTREAATPHDGSNGAPRQTVEAKGFTRDFSTGDVKAVARFTDKQISSISASEP